MGPPLLFGIMSGLADPQSPRRRESSPPQIEFDPFARLQPQGSAIVDTTGDTADLLIPHQQTDGATSEMVEPIPLLDKARQTLLLEGLQRLLQIDDHPGGKLIAVDQLEIDVAQLGPGLIDLLPFTGRHRQIETDADHQMTTGTGATAHLYQNARQLAALIVEVVRPLELDPPDNQGTPALQPLPRRPPD